MQFIIRKIAFAVLTFTIFLCGKQVFAQNLQWSNPEKSAYRNAFIDVIGQNENAIYLLKRNLRQPNRDLLLDRYSSNLKLLGSNALVPGADEYFMDLIVHSSSLHLYYSVYNKDTRQVEVRIRRYQPNLTIDGSDSILISVPRDLYITRFVQLHYFKQTSRSLLLYTEYEGDNPANINYLVLDSSPQTVQKGSVPVGLENNYTLEGAALVNNSLALLLREDVKRRVNRLGLRYSIVHGRAGSSSSFRSTNLYNDSFTVTDGFLKADFVNNKLIFGGLYSVQDSGYTKGYYMWQKYDTLSYATDQTIEFDRSIIETVAGKNNRLLGLSNLRIGDIALRHDGGLVLTAEEYQMTREVITDMNMYGIPQTNFRYYFYYENLILLSISPAAALDWYKVLRKDQITINDNGVFSSFENLVLPGKILYVYNDLSRKNWNLSIYEIDAQGNSRSQILLREQDFEGRLAPRDAKQISYNEVLIPAYTKKGTALLKITF